MDVVVQAALEHAQPICDVLQRRPVIAALVEHVRGDLDEFGPTLLTRFTFTSWSRRTPCGRPSGTASTLATMARRWHLPLPHRFNVVSSLPFVRNNGLLAGCRTSLSA